MVCTVTDNGSNFIKAFRIFGIDDKCWLADDEVIDEDEIVDFCEVRALPNHVKCASHTVSRLANQSMKKALAYETYKKMHVSVFGKLSALWKKSNRPKTSEILKEVLGISINVPGPVR